MKANTRLVRLLEGCSRKKPSNPQFHQNYDFVTKSAVPKSLEMHPKSPFHFQWLSTLGTPFCGGRSVEYFSCVVDKEFRHESFLYSQDSRC